MTFYKNGWPKEGTDQQRWKYIKQARCDHIEAKFESNANGIKEEMANVEILIFLLFERV